MKIISFILIFTVTFVNATTTIIYNDNKIEITADGEVYVDGKEYTNNMEIEQDTQHLYRSKNVDSYNKWYNKYSHKHKNIKTKCNLCQALKSIALGLFIIVFMISSYKIILLINKKIKLKKKLKKKQTILNKPKIELEEIKSAIKNKNL